MEFKDGKSNLNKEIDSLTDLSSQFYTRIPNNFGRQKMSFFVIKDLDSLKTKMDLVSNLIDIKAGQVIQEKASKSADGLKLKKKKSSVKKNEKLPNPIDTTYENLKCKIKTLDSADPMYVHLMDYLHNSS